MDILTISAMERLRNDLLGSTVRYNAYFPERPIWGMVTAAAGSANGAVSYYGRDQVHPLVTWNMGASAPWAPPSIAQYMNSEMVNSGYYFAGNTTTQPTTYGLSPQSGYNGIASHLNSGCIANLDLWEEGIRTLYFSSAASYAQTHGVVLGEPGYDGYGRPNYVQGIDIGTIGSTIWIMPNTGPSDGILGSESFSRPWNTLNGMTLSAHTAGGATSTSNLGMVCYNRANNTLAMLAYHGSNRYYRLHVFKNLPQKLKADASHLKTILEKATAGQDGASYETFDFDWASGDGNNETWALRLIYCDDHTAWLTRMNESSSFTLARIYFSSGTTRAFQTVQTHSLTTCYGRAQAGYYGPRHMMSDDQTMVALYCPYYYYLCGIMAFFVPRDSAATSNRYRFFTNTDSTYGFSIAPCGGKSFALNRNTNQDSRYYSDVYKLPLDGVALNGSALSATTGFWFPGYGTSTNYGGSMAVKVQPAYRNTTEYKETVNG